MKLFDTITAISTPIGEGGIGIVRISGPLALPIASKIFTFSRRSKKKLKTLETLKTLEIFDDIKPYTLTHGYIISPQTQEKVDEVLLALMLAPNSYTKEDLVEINCHGGLLVMRKILELVVDQGARLAEPGEFTKRAFLNGRLDLAQAEAVADLIRSKTDLALKIAVSQLDGKLSQKVKSLRKKLIDLLAEVEASIDFPDEDLDFLSSDEAAKGIYEIIYELDKLITTADEGKILKEGIGVAIIGRPNVGKSSLLNALLKEERAIVTPIPGTTRDIIEEPVNIKGVPLRVIDTAGIRDTEDIVEKIGVERSKKQLQEADLALLVVDISEPICHEDLQLIRLCQDNDKKYILVANKCDLPEKMDLSEIRAGTSPAPTIKISSKVEVVKVSATEEIGLEELKSVMLNQILKTDFSSTEAIMVTSLRHKDALCQAKTSLEHTLESLQTHMPPEFVAVDMRIALDSLGEIVGATTTEDILDRIFSQFCIGK